MEKSEKICVICGKDYSDEIFDLVKPGHCFQCSHWEEQYELDTTFRSNPENNQVVIIVDGCHYVADIDTNKKDDFFKGFGGSNWYVKFNDGRIGAFDNVWHQGEIPERFRQKLPDNAVFITQEQYVELSQKAIEGYIPQTWMQEKLLTEEGYSPYCGNSYCSIMPRTRFNGEQFYCSCCGWVSNFPKSFVRAYKRKWNK